MDFLGQVLAWYTDPANWSGNNGIPLRLWQHLIAPVAAGLALAFFAFLVVANYSLVSGSTSTLVNWLPALIPIVAAIGFVIGLRRTEQTPLDALERFEVLEEPLPAPPMAV